MPIVPAVITEDFHEYSGKFYCGLMGVPASSTTPGVQWDPRIKFFRVGEGGWEDPGTGRVRRVPDPALRRLAAPLVQDIDALVDPTRGAPRYNQNPLDPLYSIGYFQKDLGPADFVAGVAPRVAVNCLLDFGEFNEDTPGSGRNPEIWEIGLFCDHPTIAGQSLMVAYGTFPGQTKNAGIQLLTTVYLVG